MKYPLSLLSSLTLSLDWFSGGRSVAYQNLQYIEAQAHRDHESAILAGFGGGFNLLCGTNATTSPLFAMTDKPHFL
jgi:hypothetical protein